MKKTLSMVLTITLILTTFSISCVSALASNSSTTSGIDTSQYITDSNAWITREDGTFVDNLPEYSFYENTYYSSEISGGSLVRKKNYVRGIGFDGYYSLASDGYTRPTDVIEADASNINELRITGSREWSSVNNVDASAGYIASRRTAMLNYHAKGYTNSTTMSGNNAVGIVFDDKTYNSFNNILDPVNIKNTLGIEGLLLGNEYTNCSDAESSYGGYDDYTQTQFQEWLSQKFGSLYKFNQKMGTYYLSWTSIPKVTSWSTGSQRKIWLEFYLFLQSKFEDLMQEAYTSAKNVAPDVNIGYAKIMGNYNSFADDADLSFLDIGGQNIYYNWDNNFNAFSYKLNNQISLYGSKPFYATETGIPNSYENSANLYKQTFALMYMHPQVAGSYAFVYSDKNDTWGLVKADRSAKTSSYYALKQLYTDFEYLDNYYTGASESSIVAITNSGIDKALSDSNIYDLNSILMSHGVSTKIISSKDTEAVLALNLDRLILADKVIYQTPDSSDDVASAANEYLSANSGNKLLAMNGSGSQSTMLYGENSAYNQLINNSAYSSSLKTFDDDQAWPIIAEFLHKDFVEGNVSIKENTIDSSAVRILDSSATAIDDIEQTLVYKNGRLYLSVVNTGGERQDVSVTLGVNNGIRINLHPELIVADGNVSVTKPKYAVVPAWVAENNSIDSSIAYGTVEIENLSTYAFVDLGMAVYNGATDLAAATEETESKLLFSFEEYPADLNEYIDVNYGVSIDYSTEKSNEGNVSLKINSSDTKYQTVKVYSDIYSDFSGSGLSFWYSGNLTQVILYNNDTAICSIPVASLTVRDGVVCLDYNVYGLSQKQINKIDAIGFLFKYDNENLTSYIDSIRVINPNEIIVLEKTAVSDITSTDSLMYEQFLRGTVNIAAKSSENGIDLYSPTQGYPSVYLSFGYYCENVSITFKNTGNYSFVVSSYLVKYMDGSSETIPQYRSVAVKDEYVISLSGLYIKGISNIQVVFNACKNGDANTPNDIAMEITQISVTGIRSERILNAVKIINSMNPFNHYRAFSYYNSLCEEEKKYVYNSSKLNDFQPDLKGTSICMDDNIFNGQLTYNVQNPKKLTADINDCGYEAVEIGIIILPKQLLSGELNYDTANAKKASLQLNESVKKENYPEYKAIMKNSTDYAFVNMSARAFVKYSNGLSTVVLYNNEVLTRSLNTTYRLVANEYLNVYQTERFDKETDFTKSYSLSTVSAYVKEAYSATK